MLKIIIIIIGYTLNNFIILVDGKIYVISKLKKKIEKKNSFVNVETDPRLP